MFAIDAAARRMATVAVIAVRMPWSKGIGSCTFLVGLLAGAGLTLQIHRWSTSSLNLCLSSSAGLRQVNSTQTELVLAFTLYPVTAPAGQIAVLTAAVAALVGFLLWSKRATSALSLCLFSSGSSSCGLRSRESATKQIKRRTKGAVDPAARGGWRSFVRIALAQAELSSSAPRIPS